MKTIGPPKLQQGDTIGIIAPCLPILASFRDNYERGKAELESMGFNIKEGVTINQTKSHWYASATPKQQADDINSMFANPNIKAIVSAVGGHSAITVLQYLDYDLIRQNPKPFIGMSDMTCYHLAIYAKTGMVGFHMDEVTFGLGSDRPGDRINDYPDAKKAYFDVLTQTEPLGLLPHTIAKPRESWRDGIAEGVLIGGNLNSMTYQMGTPYFPKVEDFDGAILFWESVGESKYNIMKSLHQLKYYGVLERISGMLIGTITDVSPSDDQEIIEPELRDIVLEVTKDFNFPIMAGISFGHYTVNIPMPLGIKARFDTDNLSLSLEEAATE
jgi:muramoyltetrapeptide carboxypeptidase